MKIITYILLFIFLFQNSGCKKNSQKLKKTTEITEIDSTKNIKILDNLFVKAKNGLIYRDKPDGKVLGKFSYNKQLHIIEYTNIIKEFYDDGKLIKGQWVKVLDNKKILYVFDAYLTNWKDVSQLISENEHYIDINNFYNSKVREYENDTTVIREIDFKEFAAISEIQKEEFERVFNQNIKSKKVDSIIKNNNILTINCNNGKITKIEDQNIDNDEESDIHQYITTFEKIKSHLIISRGWEWSNYSLVNYETCKIIGLDGFPIFNSDYSTMICVSNNIGDEFILMNYFDGTNIKLKYLIDILPITPNRSVLNNKTLFMESITKWNDGKQHKISRQYFKMDFKEFQYKTNPF